MPQTRIHSTNAQRQKAYRERNRLGQQGQLNLSVPAAPALNNIPAEKRWRALMELAKHSLAIAGEEMEAYESDRSEKWKEGEKGEAFTDRMQTITQLAEDIADLV